VTVIANLLADHVVYVNRGWFPWFPVVPLFFIGVWVVLLAVVFRRGWRANPRRTAESVLAERYARGEISESELHQRRTVLRGLK
jgi:putative membrane protein